MEHEDWLKELEQFVRDNHHEVNYRIIRHFAEKDELTEEEREQWFEYMSHESSWDSMERYFNEVVVADVQYDEQKMERHTKYYLDLLSRSDELREKCITGLRKNGILKKNVSLYDAVKQQFEEIMQKIFSL